MDILNFVIDALKEHPLMFLFVPAFAALIGYGYADENKFRLKVVAGAVVMSLLLVCYAHSHHAQIQLSAGVWQVIGFVLLVVAVALHFYLKRERRQLQAILDSLKLDIIDKQEIVRDGIVYTFCELKGGRFWVKCVRRMEPHLVASFPIDDKAVAIAWRDDGVVPAGEISELLPKLKNGTWPVPSGHDPFDPWSFVQRD